MWLSKLVLLTLLAGTKENNPVYQVIKLQLIGLLLAVIAVYFVGNSLFGISVLWGGVTALANTVLLWCRMRPERNPTADPHRHLRMMYRSSLERFFVVAVLLVLGMMKLHLVPLAILLGFVAGQVALVVVPLIRGLKVK